MHYNGRSDFVRLKWHCPNCPESSGRYWNLERHIDRKQAGVCKPVREDGSIHQRNAAYQPYGFQSLPTNFNIHHHFQSRQKEYEISDSMEKILEPLRQISEFKILTSQLLALNQRPISKVNPNLRPPQTVDFTSRQPIRIQNQNNITSPNSTEESEIIGYRGYVCLTCLTAEPLPVYGDKLGVKKTVHECNPERVEEVRNLGNRNEIIQKLYAELPKK